MYNLSINGNDYEVIIKEVTEEDVTVDVNGVEHIVSINKITNLAAPQCCAETSAPLAPKEKPEPVQPVTPPTSAVQAAGDGAICSPLPGHILEIAVAEGDHVLVGQKILVLEAMKLENIITTDRTGTVKKILVSVGDAVNHDQSLVVIS